MIFCTKCGKQLDDDALFCSKCGTPVKQEPEEQPTEVLAPAAPETQTPPANGDDIEILVKGILSVVLSWLGIPGVILGALTRKSVRSWISSGKRMNGKVKTGKILGKVGFILGFVMIGIYIFYLLLFILLVLLLHYDPKTIFLFL